MVMAHHSFNFSIFPNISKLFRRKRGQKACKSRYPPPTHTQDALQVVLLLLLSSASCSLPPFPPPRPRLSVTEAKTEQNEVQDEINNSRGLGVEIV